MTTSRRLIAALLLLAPLAGQAALPTAGAEEARTVMAVALQGAINPASAEYVTDALDRAAADPSVHALVLLLDTPGGLDASMREIIQKIEGSPVPVITYVSPPGGRAASAGAFITMASHVAAMAPSTVIGAASPVSLGGMPGQGEGGSDETMIRKVTNDAAAFIRTLAARHDRNADWGEKFVREASSLSETEAVAEKVVDLVAPDLPSLLEAIDGRTVTTSLGPVTLATAHARLERVEMNSRQRFLDLLADPNVAYLLMMLGFYGLLFELGNPGAILPGVVGGVCLILAFYAFQTIPVNSAGLLLILLGVAMLAAEIWVTSHGLLTAGGVGALVVGSVMLVDSPAAYLQISLTVIVPTALFTAAFFLFLVGTGIRAQYAKRAIGHEALTGERGIADADLAPGGTGTVAFQGEVWSARLDGNTPVGKGEEVEVTAVEGLTLTVRPAAGGPIPG